MQQQYPLLQEPLLYFHTAAAVSTPAQAFPVFLHCRSSVRSRRCLPFISTLPQQYPLPQEPLLYFHTAAVVSTSAQASSVFLHCRSSVCSRRSLLHISTLLQQYLLLQEPPLYFHTAAAVSAPAGPSSLLPHSTPAQAFPVFLHCRSSVRSCRYLPFISTLPQQYPLPQEPSLYFHSAAAVSALQKPSPYFYIAAVVLLPQEPFLYFLTAAAVSAPAGASSLLPHCHSSDCSLASRTSASRSPPPASTMPTSLRAPSSLPTLPQQSFSK
ncbi:hypothetical protein ROHU_005433 [Labeo rohita]|uniref:Uncharacterized protein n=1 Tax=Labeo rohita TaxID=84645 RepID=A0A498N4E8_LABRO|nr:hypothetical protein ROHU_005433 [Labeo rohita]